VGSLAVLGLVAVAVVVLFKGGSEQHDGTAQTLTQEPPAAAPEPGVTDVDLIPGDAQGFAVLRVADLWNADLARKALAEATKQKAAPPDPARTIVEQIGLDPVDVERITIVLADAQKQIGWGLVTTAKPLDRDTLISKWLKGRQAKQTEHAGRTLEMAVTPDGMRFGVCFLSKSLFLAGPEVGVKRCLDLVGKRPAGPLDGAIGRVGEKHLLLVAATFPPDLMKQLRQGLSEEMEAVKPLFDMAGATLALDLERHLTLDVSLRLPDEVKCKEAKRVVEDLAGLARLSLPSFKNGLVMKALPPGMVPAFYEQLRAALLRVYVEQAAAEVRVRTFLDVQAMADTLLPSLPALVTGDGLLSPLRPRIMQHQNNLLQLALAMHNYQASVKTGLLPAAIYSKDGKTPLLSWRVALLPWIGEDALLQQFHLDEPWDSPHNKKLLPRMPKPYRLPGDPADSYRTCYQVFVGPGTIWPDAGQPGFHLARFHDGTQNTILIAEAKEKVEWTRPVDLSLQPGKDPRELLGGQLLPGFFYVVMADARPLKVPLRVSEETIRNAIGPADNRLLGPDWPKREQGR
jgi:hypothetical protein